MTPEAKAWQSLVEAAKSGKSRSFNVALTIQVEGEPWQAYGAEVSYRDILLFCKQGTASFAVDSYGSRDTFELVDWERST